MPDTVPVHVAAPPLAPNEPVACDLFCAVIDNFGDIGVCWRLARQLADEHGWQVRLLVDDLHTFVRLVPDVDPDAARQTIDGIAIEHWHAEVGDTLEIADVVIEAFACELPAAYLAAMARRARRPVWINLEYLSAEDWVADFHLRPSPHPRYPLLKTFFFPGLSAGTGGVLKERDLDARRIAFETDAAARDAWWRRATGGAPPAPDATVVSLFAYENRAVDALLAQWRDAPSPVVALVPAGRVSPALARFFGVESFGAGAQASRGNLTAHGLAFVPQPDYDALLWSADLNFVRGEDSFVRAQWARKPFVWHIYPQADDAHLPKLDAALAHLSAGLADAPRAALARFWHAWNGAGTPDWADLWQHRAALQANAERWADALAAVGDLAGKLAEYAKSQLK
ncbi:elongation factor P maturation arginine rhamnosyltransferase EarP [Burkholderia multivorans]|uniref:elongation factor P maturation arginine rhamnosyltransferase EarP n=1 Tax=Burkholderia multivorans TaxID=87883 RepID=UPI0009E0D15A|nr:elongation factor P maturation arginine rhamnosyltransferase EarP [Burkholderia multivorans]MCA7956289.1 elongation factor P maturation arginine rhamnosyltransferase EarP [Burkholderia multivorans]MDN7593426.1 elongation factor P maturation arginine rhamnosyltransferase EarP [Burkholderia multivorans]PRG02782.1 elongation factor P maturation arginine rhamnosyltransferase EarP [Burkholderia multivorans]PRH27369.1 elongation factor P maturation arginine rhamnosyltransferase EarP [Burkholderia 